jgi:hypothetical protein
MPLVARCSDLDVLDGPATQLELHQVAAVGGLGAVDEGVDGLWRQSLGSPVEDDFGEHGQPVRGRDRRLDAKDVVEHSEIREEDVERLDEAGRGDATL